MRICGAFDCFEKGRLFVFIPSSVRVCFRKKIAELADLANLTDMTYLKWNKDLVHVKYYT